LKYGNNISSHYIDSFGFEGLAGFLGDENQEAIFTKPVIEKLTNDIKTKTYSQVGNTLPEYSDPTVAELEADVKSGKSISLNDLAKAVHAERKPTAQKGKPSLLDRVEKGKQKSAQQGQPDTYPCSAIPQA